MQFDRYRYCCDAMASTSSTASPRRRRQRCRSSLLATTVAALAVAVISTSPGVLGAQALELSLAHGDGHRLRTRSTADLQDWALAERQRIVGRYGPAAAGLAQGLQPLKKRKHSHDIEARQFDAQPSGSTSRASTAVGTRSAAAATSASTAVSTPNNRTINPRTGYASLTNYQSDLYAVPSGSMQIWNG